MRKLLYVSLLIGILGIGSACATTDARKDNPNATPAAMSDSDLENQIKAKFNADSNLRAADLGVDADVNRKEVTLTGTVHSQAMRTKAVELARGAYSGLIVNDKIDVKPGEITRENYTEEMAREERESARTAGDNIGDTLDDAWIHTKLVAKLIGNTTTPERKINVDVNNNVVTLRGTVDTNEQKMEAERVAKETEGVKQVRNQLKVASR